MADPGSNGHGEALRVSRIDELILKIDHAVELDDHEAAQAWAYVLDVYIRGTHRTTTAPGIHPVALFNVRQSETPQ